MKKSNIAATVAISGMLAGATFITASISSPQIVVQAKAVQKQLIPGTYTVGKDINAGRYTVTATGGSGNFSTEPKHSLTGESVNEILQRDDPDMGVSQVTADFAKGDKVEISGMAGANFAPVTNRDKSNTSSLSTGYWVVGKDIKAGNYTVTPADGQSGNFMVDPKSLTGSDVNEVLGGDTDMHQVPKVNVSLHKGDKITISGMNSVNFVNR
ncbi:hypothetical protein [Furfurilactobacillus rossiae]|uniref:DUF5666 domain-containing protein n=1 Tax=Furfurilactobacillus rossiae DSM 15814 TaxID=1114972 RepID=A0A0R1R8Y7_9LACO|nr:hypothetical protein [Furfurilactobacillus rossiae]KRL53153.1 hypothetical protein FD35_GL001395 [Furfurilactobacillus rossiae DSM 15814]QFR66273.1 hypothetical protein LR814_03725 [Furfurilactobacillus rossiae]QLE61718.1 hypothetical protein LROSRS0_1672 [Furfurilactobacillus rossiae]